MGSNSRKSMSIAREFEKSIPWPLVCHSEGISSSRTYEEIRDSFRAFDRERLATTRRGNQARVFCVEILGLEEVPKLPHEAGVVW